MFCIPKTSVIHNKWSKLYQRNICGHIYGNWGSYHKIKKKRLGFEIHSDSAKISLRTKRKAQRRLVKHRKGNYQSMHKREKKRHTPRCCYVEPLLGTEHAWRPWGLSLPEIHFCYHQISNGRCQQIRKLEMDRISILRLGWLLTWKKIPVKHSLYRNPLYHRLYTCL